MASTGSVSSSSGFTKAAFSTTTSDDEPHQGATAGFQVSSAVTGVEITYHHCTTFLYGSSTPVTTKQSPSSKVSSTPHTFGCTSCGAISSLLSSSNTSQKNSPHYGSNSTPPAWLNSHTSVGSLGFSPSAPQTNWAFDSSSTKRSKLSDSGTSFGPPNSSAYSSQPMNWTFESSAKCGEMLDSGTGFRSWNPSAFPSLNSNGTSSGIDVTSNMLHPQNCQSSQGILSASIPQLYGSPASSSSGATSSSFCFNNPPIKPPSLIQAFSSLDLGGGGNFQLGSGLDHYKSNRRIVRVKNSRKNKKC